MSLQGRAFLTLWRDFCFLPSPTKNWDSSRQWVSAWIGPQSKHQGLMLMYRFPQPHLNIEPSLTPTPTPTPRACFLVSVVGLHRTPLTQQPSSGFCPCFQP